MLRVYQDPQHFFCASGMTAAEGKTMNDESTWLRETTYDEVMGTNDEEAVDHFDIWLQWLLGAPH
jgi:hypothetical protein